MSATGRELLLAFLSGVKSGAVTARHDLVGGTDAEALQYGQSVLDDFSRSLRQDGGGALVVEGLRRTLANEPPPDMAHRPGVGWEMLR